MRLPLVALALAFVLAAGCTTPTSPTSSPTPSSSATPTVAMTTTVGPPTSSSYFVMAHDVPATVAAGAAFQVQVMIEGNDTRTSDHIGAHFGPTHTDAPSTTVYTSACVHAHGDLPGTYMIGCTAPTQPGTYYLRGHARITNSDGSQVNWWSDEQSFTVS